jgi:hypothetical protein
LEARGTGQMSGPTTRKGRKNKGKQPKIQRGKAKEPISILKATGWLLGIITTIIGTGASLIVFLPRVTISPIGQIDPSLPYSPIPQLPTAVFIAQILIGSDQDFENCLEGVSAL